VCLSRSHPLTNKSQPQSFELVLFVKRNSSHNKIVGLTKLFLDGMTVALFHTPCITLAFKLVAPWRVVGKSMGREGWLEYVIKKDIYTIDIHRKNYNIFKAFA